MNKRNIVIAIVLIVAGYFLYSSVFGTESITQTEVELDKTKQVNVAVAGSLYNSEARIVSYGQVVSSTGVEVTPLISGITKTVRKKLGDFVNAGEVVVEMYNSTQSQGVLQAQASLASAQAGQTRVAGSQSGDLSNLELAKTQAKTNEAQARSGMVIALQGVETVLSGLLQNNLGDFYSDSESVNRKFIPLSNSQIGEREVEGMYGQLITQTLSYSNKTELLNIASTYSGEAITAKELVSSYRTYVQNMINLVNTVTDSVSNSESVITAWKTTLTSAKQTIEAQNSAIVSAETALNNAQATLAQAENNLATLQSVGQSTDSQVAQSGVQAARATLGSAQIELAKTKILAPISGKISAMNTRSGEFVTPGVITFGIANASTLRVDTYLSARETARIEVGSDVLINNEYEAVVSRIAPAIDSKTGKVLVEILPTNQTLELVEGLGVGLSIKQSVENFFITIPIEAVFVRGGESYVYILENNVAVPRIVQTKALYGPMVEVQSGIELTESIILYARGLKDNEEVTVNEEVVSNEDSQ